MNISKLSYARISTSGRPRILKRVGDIPKLTAARLARMRRSFADSVDPIRYILVVPLFRNRALHYRAEDDSYGSHISQATLFKRLKTAEAVRRSIPSARLRKALQIVRVKKTKAGIRLVAKMKSPR